MKIKELVIHWRELANAQVAAALSNGGDELRRQRWMTRAEVYLECARELEENS
jgi:hypothetical protein